MGVDNRYRPGILFELTEAESITDTPLANYEDQTGLLSLPRVTVDNTVYNGAEMSLIHDTETMHFAVSTLRE